MMTTKTRKRASATSPVVITDKADGSREFVVDEKKAATLTTTPEAVVDAKTSMYGHGGHFEGAYGRIGGNRDTAKPAMKPGQFGTVRGRSGARVGKPLRIEALPSKVAQTAHARRAKAKAKLLARLAKSAMTEEEKSALVDGILDDFDESTQDLSDDLNEFKAAAFEIADLAAQAPSMIERAVAERDEARGEKAQVLDVALKLQNAASVYVQAQAEKQAALVDGMEVVDDAFVFRFTVAGHKFVSVVRETEPEPIALVAPEVKTFERTPDDPRYGEKYETPALRAGLRIERKMAQPMSYETAEFTIQRHAERMGRK